jgi:hypothetical protein
LKVTDVSELSNPFVIFEDSPVSTDGILSIDPGLRSQIKNLSSDPRDYFPWLKKPQDIERRTLKIEVVYRSDLIMCRYLHLNRLYPIEYPKIALQISNNIYQNQYLLYKEGKIQRIYEQECAVQQTGQPTLEAARGPAQGGSQSRPEL